MDWVFAFLAGVAASFINIFAGGGSLVTLPVLFFLGLPAPIANGTNKIGLLFGTFTGTLNYGRKKVLPWKEALFTAPFAVGGSVLGSLFSIDLSEKTYRLLLSAVMVMVLVMILVRPQRFVKKAEHISLAWRRAGLILLFFSIGFYGGFIQAGMGYLIILALSLFWDDDLVKISAYKSLIGFVIVLFSSLVFIFKGLINWPIALFLAAGNALGAWLGSQLASSKGEKVMRPILAVIVVAMAVKLFWESLA